jgi:hypothetical protein
MEWQHRKQCHRPGGWHGKVCQIIRMALVLALAWYSGIMEILYNAMSSPSGGMLDLYMRCHNPSSAKGGGGNWCDVSV